MKARRKSSYYVGREFGMLRVLEIVTKTDRSHPIVSCRCACGATVTRDLWNITAGQIRSCGGSACRNLNRLKTMADKAGYDLVAR